MNLLSVSRLTRHGRIAPLFSDISFGLESGEKVALIGRNGCGKSTLLSCIAQRLQPDGGTVTINKSAGISYLPQTPTFSSSDTIQAHIFKSDNDQLQTIRQYELVCEEISQHTEIPTQLQKSLDELTQVMDQRDLWNYEQRIKSVLTTLGITDLSLSMGQLSGGMIKKVALAQVLVEDTALLLLDEPTNHLDLVTISWLEDYLRTTDRSVLMVTHDRYFLDAVCSSIYELTSGSLIQYLGNFSFYLQKKEQAEQIAANTEARIESVLRKEREWLLRGPKARSTKARARVDAVNRMINREKLAQEDAFSFAVTSRRLGGKVLETIAVSKAFNTDAGKKIVLSDFSYKFRKGERIGVFGNNGTGKTTLLNILTGTIPSDTGKITPGVNTVFGYFKQNPELEISDQTVLGYIQEKAVIITMADGTELTAPRLLERFGISGAAQHAPVRALSGGERKRVYLVRLLMMNPNFLVLDEPTNDFDIYTMSILEDFLSEYVGCLLVVSHDRFFMDRTVDSLFVLDETGTVSGFAGSCSEYLAVLTSRNELPIENTPKQSEYKPVPRPEKPKKRTFKEQKEFEHIEEEILALEEKKEGYESFLSSGETNHVILREKAEKLTRITAQIEEKYNRWEDLSSLS